MTPSDSIIFFSNFKKGQKFWVHYINGEVFLASFISYYPDSTAGKIKFGVYIYSESSEYSIRYFNLNALEDPNVEIVNFTLDPLDNTLV